MHRLGTVLATSYHEDELRRADVMRRVRREPDFAASSEAADTKPTLRRRIVSAFRPTQIRPAGA